MKHHWTLVDTPAPLAEAEKAIRSEALIALDTEYDSFRCFRDKLCLIQVQTAEHTWLIDPLAGLDLAFLGDVLKDPEILKIFHAGDNDIRILKRDYDFSFRNIFDTHRAASLLGCRHLSLATLLESYLGVFLVKKMQRSRWDLRPLSEEQLDYAALDTAHLFALYRRLDGELREKGKLAEAERLFGGMTEVVWKEKTLDRLAHRRAPGYAQLTAEQKDRLRRLFRWRFEKGQELDRAPFMVLADQQLVALAKLEALAPAAVAAVLPSDKAHRFTPELAALLAT
ncbi:MAG: ribonuclease D [Deltaproteobacteria bacterium]|nr:ribonuclease D [Deltaproteobacteria bacterium]